MSFKISAVACLTLVLSACGAPPARKSSQGVTGVGPAPVAPSGSPAYVIDSTRSELRVLVYRAGPMARLGHNHVIVNRAITGRVDPGVRPESSGFSLRVPVADFAVDEAAARAAEGEDFSADVSDDAKAGTRRNMLGAALLAADRYPVITLSSRGISRGPEGGLTAELTAVVAGHESTLRVPFVLESSPTQLAAAGSATLRQSDLGLTPISVMLGALQVQDEITVKFRLVAIPAAAP